MLAPLPQIQTDRLTLRLVDKTDLPDLLEINGNDTVTRYLPYASWKDMADGQAWLDRAAVRLAASEAWQFVVAHRASGRVIGACLLFHPEPASGRMEVGYVLGQAHWGAGYMLEAMTALVGFAFGEVGLRRLEAEIDPRNASSARLLERLGFINEGLLRQRWYCKGEVSDSALYGLLRAEWRPPRSGR